MRQLQAKAKGATAAHPVVVDSSTGNDEAAQPKEGTLAWVKQQLACYDDFKAETSQLVKLFRRRGHRVNFLPKFHCELAFSELYWCLSKRFCRSRCTYNFAALCKLIEDSFKEAAIGSITRQRFSRKTRLLAKMYFEKKLGPEEAAKAAQEYKTHRPPFYNANAVANSTH